MIDDFGYIGEGMEKLFLDFPDYFTAVTSHGLYIHVIPIPDLCRMVFLAFNIFQYTPTVLISFRLLTPWIPSGNITEILTRINVV